MAVSRGDEVELARAMRAAGSPLAEVAALLGVSVSWVSRACRAPGSPPAWSTPAEVEAVRDLVEGGATVREAAEELGMSPSAVQRARWTRRVPA